MKFLEMKCRPRFFGMGGLALLMMGFSASCGGGGGGMGLPIASAVTLASTCMSIAFVAVSLACALAEAGSGVKPLIAQKEKAESNRRWSADDNTFLPEDFIRLEAKPVIQPNSAERELCKV